MLSSVLSGNALRGVRVVSLALNLPGPAALLRLKALGASCLKIEPAARTAAGAGGAAMAPGQGKAAVVQKNAAARAVSAAASAAAGTAAAARPARSSTSGDPMAQYSATAYAALHQGLRVRRLDLKTAAGQAALHRELGRAQVLLTSFRPSALRKLGLGWRWLHTQHPHLSLVSIVGAPGAQANEPGHDLTYQAEAGLVNGLTLPVTLFADMAGALLATEAVLAAVLGRQARGCGVQYRVALSQAAHWLALPLHWGLTQPGAVTGGGHAGYRIYACQDGRVAVAALEPHFAAALCKLAGLTLTEPRSIVQPAAHRAVAAFMARHRCSQLEALAAAHDIPLLTLPPQPSCAKGRRP